MNGEYYHAPKHIFGHTSQEMTEAVSAEASAAEAAGDQGIPKCMLKAEMKHGLSCLTIFHIPQVLLYFCWVLSGSALFALVEDVNAA